MKLAQLALAIARTASRDTFFALLSSFSSETEFTKFASEEIATARSRHNSGRHRIPMPASPRHRARCNSHEARAWIVAVTSCCLVRLSSGGMGPPDEIALSSPARTRRFICRGAAVASRLDPLAFSGTRGRSKALFYAVLNGTSISDPEPVNFSCDPEIWACGHATSEPTAKDMISAPISFPTRAVVQLLDCLPECVAHDFCNPEDPDALGDDSSFFAVTQQHWRACIRRTLRSKEACILPPSSLDPRSASGAFAVAKDDCCDGFVGDRRLLNGFERSIGRAHLPCCPRLRRMILGKSETVQSAIRDTKDSGVDSNTWTMRIWMWLILKSWVGFRKISSKRVLPSNLSLKRTSAKLG